MHVTRQNYGGQAPTRLPSAMSRSALSRSTLSSRPKGSGRLDRLARRVGRIAIRFKMLFDRGKMPLPRFVKECWVNNSQWLQFVWEWLPATISECSAFKPNRRLMHTLIYMIKMFFPACFIAGRNPAFFSGAIDLNLQF